MFSDLPFTSHYLQSYSSSFSRTLQAAVWMTPRKFVLGNHTIGTTGVLFVEEIVYISGATFVQLNCQMGAMDGFDLFWTGNWRPCTPVEVRKVVPVPLKVGQSFWTNCNVREVLFRLRK